MFYLCNAETQCHKLVYATMTDFLLATWLFGLYWGQTIHKCNKSHGFHQHDWSHEEVCGMVSLGEKGMSGKT